MRIIKMWFLFSYHTKKKSPGKQNTRHIYTCTLKSYMQQKLHHSYSKKEHFRKHWSGLTAMLCRCKFIMPLGSPHLPTDWPRRRKGSFLWQIPVGTWRSLSLHKHWCEHSASVTPAGVNYKVLSTKQDFK